MVNGYGEEREARRKALRLLEHMDRTEKGLRDKLIQSGFSETVSEDAIAYVKDYGYINDQRYAFNYIMYRIHSKSRQKLFQELQQKGVSPQLIQAAWEEASELEEPDERTLLRETIQKKCEPGDVLDDGALRRLYGFLQRRGFRGSDIASTLEELNITRSNYNEQ
nr:regulatory protein RecX [uncultured Blautia sp.]